MLSLLYKKIKNKEMTIAQQLNVKEFPFEIKDSNGKVIYCESSGGCWSKQEYDSNGKVIYCESSGGCWSKQEYDSNGNEIYCEHSYGFWYKQEYDSNGNKIYYEDSDGGIRDNRPKEYTMDEVAKALGINVSQLKIKK